MGTFFGLNNITQNKLVLDTNISKERKISKAYILDDGERFNPTDARFENYWLDTKFQNATNGMVAYYNAKQLFAIKDVSIVENDYVVDFYYSHKRVLKDTSEEKDLKIFVEVGEESLQKNFKISSEEYSYDLFSYEIPVSYLETNNSIAFNARLTINSINSQLTNDSQSAVFYMENYLQKNTFAVNWFEVVTSSITKNSFEFLIDINFPLEKHFNSLVSNLVLNANRKDLKTTFIKSKSTEYIYKVSDLQPETVYKDFYIKIDNSIHIGLIIGLTLFAIFIIISIIFLLLILRKYQNQTEHNIYTEYSNYVDPEIEYIGFNEPYYLEAGQSNEYVSEPFNNDNTLTNEDVFVDQDPLGKNTYYQQDDVETTKLLEGYYEVEDDFIN